MAMVSDDEKEALRVAALAVKPLLERLEAQRANLDARLAKLRAVVEAWESSSGRRPKQPDTNGTGTNGDQPTIRRGEVGQRIFEVLKEGGVYTETQLRVKLAERFRVSYSRGGVYSALRRGEKKSPPIYENTDGRWKIIGA